MTGPGLIGRAAAIHDLAIRRDEIKLRNALARAVRRVHELYENPSRPCPDCGGSGYAPDRNPTGEQPPYLYSSEPCPRCDLSGRIGVAR